MRLDQAHLDALRCAVDAGTFEAAARRLHVTPSAVSQRIRALEESVGRVLLRRSKPIEATASGVSLLRLARQIDLLSDDVAREFGAELGGADGFGGDGSSGAGSSGVDDADAPLIRLPIAVNADSLATWILPALAPLTGRIAFDLHREDETHTDSLLRDGTVMAAITAVARPVQGCSSVLLGNMRYRPMMSRAFAERWFPADGAADAADAADAVGAAGAAGAARAAGAAGTVNATDAVTAERLGRAPVVVFDARDDLQHAYLRRRAEELGAGRELVPPLQYVPGSTDFVRAVRLGFGWGMVPDLQREPGDGLVELDPGAVVDVPLHWQQWQLHTPSLDLVTRTLRAAASRALVPHP
ncbi:MAG: LysR family transcriptional regulator ArgP [Herbiconiux sp.]|nr:LysR family transcriptional regulator ArgP [Herbiconiux sp.]